MDTESIRNYFNNAADGWDSKVPDRTIIDRILDNANICEGKHVLDVGCGTGVLFPFFLERKVASVTAIDISDRMVHIARSKFPDKRIEVVCGDAEFHAFDRTFDSIVIYNAFPHLVDPQATIDHLLGSLEKGGVLTIAHGMSRQKILAIHSQKACEVSLPLPGIESLSEMLERRINVVKAISNDEFYQVVCVKGH